MHTNKAIMINKIQDGLSSIAKHKSIYKII